jgi:DNA-binding MarR family transcriptional regulator
MPEINARESEQIDAYRLFLMLHRRFLELNRDEFRPYDLSVPQYAILFHASREGVPLSVIGQKMLADNSNLTRLVDRLSKRGLVRRATDPADRRVTLIQLTDAGAAMIDELRPLHRVAVQERMSVLQPHELRALKGALQVLYDSLQPAPEDNGTRD